MIPRTIQERLGELGRRESWLAACWGAARWLALVLTLLLVACVTDYLIDRWQDTPWGVRITLFVVQLAAALAAGWWWILRPVLRRQSESELALRVEEAMPAFRHRLISAVQLNQPGAQTEGMSRELIAVVTREAEKKAAKAHFAGIAGSGRFLWSALLGVPVIVGAVLILLLVPLAPVLFARQFLVDLPVPRNVSLESVAKLKITLSGEPVSLEFQVTGKGITSELEGEVRLDPLEGDVPSEWYALEFARFTPEGAIYRAQVPPASVNFSYSAFLGDGRKTPAGEVHYVSRPVVTDIRAFVLLPESCGLKPADAAAPDDVFSRRYGVPQSGGDVVAIPGSAVRLDIKTQTPVKRAELKLLGAESSLVIPMALDASGTSAIGIFPLSEDFQASGYEILVTDAHGFPNHPLPRRTIRIVPEPPPHVTLLPVSFPDESASVVLEDHIVQGMPTYPGGPIQIAYACQGPYGLGEARLLYRLPKKATSGETPQEEEPWAFIPLAELLESDQTGPFVPKLGLFEKSSPKKDQVPFHAVPSPDPYNRLGRMQGGGRFLFKTEKLSYLGKLVDLQSGDQVEICVEVFAGKPGDGRPSARSETRVIPVLANRDECVVWALAVINEPERLRQLRKKQEESWQKR